MELHYRRGSSTANASSIDSLNVSSNADGHPSSDDEDAYCDDIDSEEETKIQEEKLKRRDKSIDDISDALVVAFFIALTFKIGYFVIMWLYPDIEGDE